ncbi:MAG: ATP-binding protein [Solirubrobacterales bacterium]
MGAVLVEGPKACGKTETARQIAKSEVRLDVDRRAREAAELDPGLVLEGEAPRLLDEWQLVPEVWNHVRRAVDDRQQTGQFILAGSAQPTDDETRHTGAGRISRLTMRPMSLFELGISKGEISLSALLGGKPGSASDAGRQLTDIAAAVCRGGWPASKDQDLPDALKGVQAYLNEIPRDTQRLGQRHRPERVRRLIESLARNVATPVTARTLAEDASQPGDRVSEDVVADYLSSLGSLFVVENQPAWQPHLRSRYRLRQSGKRHFVDPSLAVAALRGTPESLMRDLRFFGLLFESMVVRDLRVYAQPLGGEVQYYQDNSGLEVDAIVDAGNVWGAFEVKLGGTKPVDEAAANLLKFRDRVDTSRTGPPAVLGVIVASGYGYVRKDGIQVIPIACLGP